MTSILLTIKRNLTESRLTWLLIAFCGIIFISIHVYEKAPTISNETLTLFGAPNAIDIYLFQFWGITTNSFVHIKLPHFALNILSLLLLGSYVERRIGSLKFFFFGLFASTISSAFQLAFSDDAGIGLSGVNYALYGFIFSSTFIDARFKIITKHLSLVVMLFFIPLCHWGNLNWGWNVAIFAMMSGFLFGFLVATVQTVIKPLSWTLLFSSLIFSVVTLFYCPWSEIWNCAKGISHHEKGEIKQAQEFYELALTINNESSCAIDNLKIIRIDELSGLAFKAHMRGDYIKASMYYDAILKLDPRNQWAKDNKNRLP